ncbi:hypothetical protein Tco_0543668 [Tanacetum coccineum]
MIRPGRYSQWRSRFLRYIDTKANGEYMRKCIFNGPYKLTSIVIEAVVATVNALAVPKHDEAETEFGKFTSRDGESMESYYSRFYKLMNELTRNNLQVATMQQYQNEVNDIRAERIAKSANPLALLTAAQPYSDNYYQAPKPQRTNATSSSKRPSASTRHKGKEIAKPVTPQSESVSEEDIGISSATRIGNSALTARDLATMKRNAGIQSGLMIRLGSTYVSWHKDSEVLPEESSSTNQPLEQVQNHGENNVFANERRHSEQPESILTKMLQNVFDLKKRRDALANLIAKLTLDTEEKKDFKAIKESKRIIDSRTEGSCKLT